MEPLMRRRAALMCAVGCLLPAAGRAAEPAEPPTLSLDAFVQRVEDTSPEVRRARAMQRVMEARRVGAELWQQNNPSVFAGVGRRRDTSVSVPPATGPEWTLHIEQQLDTFGSRSARGAEVDASTATARIRVQQARREARARARLAYISALVAEADLQLSERQLTLADELVRITETRLDAGAAHGMELQLARAEAGRAAASVAQVRQRRDETLLQLRWLAAMEWAGQVSLATELGAPPRLSETVESLETRAVTQRLELRVLASTHEQLDATILRLRREALPSITLFADVMSQQPQQLYAGGGLGVTLPIFNAKDGEVATTRAEQQQVDDEHDLTEREVRLQVRQALAACAARWEVLHALEERVQPATEAHAQMSLEGWRAGKLEFAWVVQSLRDAATVRRQRLEALAQVWAASIELARVGGDL
jgi:outer membrane protein TolC